MLISVWFWSIKLENEVKAMSILIIKKLKVE